MVKNAIWQGEGVAIQKAKNIFQEYFRENLILYLLAAFFFFVGIIFGVLTPNILPDSRVIELKGYLEAFFSGLDQGIIPEQGFMVRNVLMQNIKILLLFWFLGITAIGLPFIIALLSLKGFTLGFTISFLFGQFSFGGLLFGLGATLPQNIFIVPAFLTVAVVALSFSLLQIRSKIRKRKFYFWHNLLNYTALFLVIALFVLVGSLVEAYITPVFIRFSLSVL